MLKRWGTPGLAPLCSQRHYAGHSIVHVCHRLPEQGEDQKGKGRGRRERGGAEGKGEGQKEKGRWWGEGEKENKDYRS